MDYFSLRITPHISRFCLKKKKKKEVLLETSEAGVEIEIKTDPLKEMGYGLLLGKNYDNDVCCVVIMFRF